MNQNELFALALALAAALPSCLKPCSWPWRVVRHYVKQAHDAQDWSNLHTIAIDKTAPRKDHRYATVAVDLRIESGKSARLLLMTPERGAQNVAQLVEAKPAHGAKAEQITQVVIDMSPADI